MCYLCTKCAILVSLIIASLYAKIHTCILCNPIFNVQLYYTYFSTLLYIMCISIVGAIILLDQRYIVYIVFIL